MVSDTVIEVKNVSKSYRGFSMENMSFEIPRGFITGLIGPNGAGKTTLIKMIMGLVFPTSGTIQVFGSDVLTDGPAIRERIGFVYDSQHFYEDQSLRTLANAYGPFYKAWNETAFLRLVDRFELPLRKPYRLLSHGMKTKFALALALSHDAELLIMDEPTSGLDPVVRRELIEMLQEILLSEHKSILFSTHITSDLDRVADYIVYIQNGTLVTQSTKAQLDEHWALVKGDYDFMTDDILKYFLGARKTSYGCIALTSQADEIRKLVPGNLLFERPTLEEIMYYVYSGERHV
jgi:ABC-2 type transport system ATP-binding protein